MAHFEKAFNLKNNAIENSFTCENAKKKYTMKLKTYSLEILN